MQAYKHQVEYRYTAVRQAPALGLFPPRLKIHNAQARHPCFAVRGVNTEKAPTYTVKCRHIWALPADRFQNQGNRADM